MAKSSKKKPNAKTEHQPDDFESVARRLDCDEDKERFEAKLGKIARQKPKESSGASSGGKMHRRR